LETRIVPSAVLKLPLSRDLVDSGMVPLKGILAVNDKATDSKEGGAEI
jgi:hypothetical protein